MMIKISPAILNDSSVYIYKISGLNNAPDYSDFFFKNRDLFTIKKPEIVLNFLKKLSINNLTFFDDSDIFNLVSIKKQIIVKYIKIINPPWIKRISWGIKFEVFKNIEDNHTNLYRCLTDCNLISDSPKTIIWWYKNFSYNNDYNKAIIGFKGERLSCIYEHKILGIDKNKIDHVALKKSDVGYDIMSVISNNNETPKPIEVKSTIRTNDAFIYITKNEWKKTVIKNYIFHLWLINENKGVADLFFIRPEELKKHIPVDSGKGNWINSKIPIKEYCQDIVVSFHLSEIN